MERIKNFFKNLFSSDDDESSNTNVNIMPNVNSYGGARKRKYKKRSTKNSKRKISSKRKTSSKKSKRKTSSKRRSRK
jgi:hypothetical protein